jgi:hypothetical protein
MNVIHHGCDSIQQQYSYGESHSDNIHEHPCLYQRGVPISRVCVIGNPRSITSSSSLKLGDSSHTRTYVAALIRSDAESSQRPRQLALIACRPETYHKRFRSPPLSVKYAS